MLSSFWVKMAGILRVEVDKMGQIRLERTLFKKRTITDRFQPKHQTFWDILLENDRGVLIFRDI